MEETTSPFVLGLNGHGLWFARFDSEAVDHIVGCGATPMEALHELLYSAKRALETMQHEADERLVTNAAGPVTTLGELRPGAIFETVHGGVRAVKSEYHFSGGQCECILLTSGEYAHFPQMNATPVREITL